ncbi:MAG TPA: TonB family protein [Acidobacteriaceae bacterium]
MPRTVPQLEPERDAFGRQAVQSLLLHVAIAGTVLGYALVAAHLHPNLWGNNSHTEGAIQATMVTSAPAIPLPREEQKPAENVLATETPSPAPAPPAPKAPPAEEEKTIPIPVKQAPKPKLQPKKAVAQPQPEKPVAAKPQPQPAPRHVQLIKPQDRANFGEAAASLPRTLPAATPAAQVNVQGGDFGARFPWYVDGIRRRTEPLVDRALVDPSLPVGTRVYVNFVIGKDGAPSGVRIARSSGSPSLDSACQRAIQRVDSYGPLPNAYNGSTLLVSYYCEQTAR